MSLRLTSPQLPKPFSILLWLIAVTAAYAELAWDAKECSATARYGETSGQVTFLCRNPGVRPISITQTKCACSCASAHVSKMTLAAGASAELNVVLRFQGERREAETHVVITTDDGVDTVLTARLQATAPFSVTPSLVSWTPGSARTGREMIVEPADGAPDIADLRVISSNPQFQIAAVPVTGTRRWKVRVKPPDTETTSVGILTFETKTGTTAVQRAYAYAKVQGVAKN
jgi:hypothetical protein